MFLLGFVVLLFCGGLRLFERVVSGLLIVLFVNFLFGSVVL